MCTDWTGLYLYSEYMYCVVTFCLDEASPKEADRACPRKVVRRIGRWQNAVSLCFKIWASGRLSCCQQWAAVAGGDVNLI